MHFCAILTSLSLQISQGLGQIAFLTVLVFKPWFFVWHGAVESIGWAHLASRRARYPPANSDLTRVAGGAAVCLLQRLGCNAELVVDEFGEKLLEELDYLQVRVCVRDGGGLQCT